MRWCNGFFFGALLIYQTKANEKANEIPVSIKKDVELAIATTEVAKDLTTKQPEVVSKKGLIYIDSPTEQAVVVTGDGIQNITTNNLQDDNSQDKKPAVFKGGVIGTTTVKTIDPNEKVLIENAVVLTGNGVADQPFIGDDVIENGTKGVVNKTAQFGDAIQARATDVTTEKTNKTSPGVYVDHVNKQTGFITRLKQMESSTISDNYIAKKIKELIKKSKENKEEEGKTTEIVSTTVKTAEVLRN